MATDSSDILQTHPYTCNSCAVAFRNSDAQRTHMRSDWHRYNLKRKVADLPPVSSDDYNKKVLTAQASTNAAAAQAAYAKSCSTCQKTYYSENAYQNHLLSQKHRLRALAARKDPVPMEKETNGETIPAEAEAEFEKVVAGMKDASIDNTEDEPLSRRPSAPPPGVDREEHPLSPLKRSTQTLPISRCFFCSYDSPNLKLSLDHMTKIHGMFIPEQNYLADLEGLVRYLQAKVNDNFECLACHKLKGSAPAVQTHMRDKGHCTIAFESEEDMIEIGQFYDFSSTYSDEEVDSDTEMESKFTNGGAKVEDGEDAGWETDSDESSVASDEIGAIPNDDRTEAYERLKLHRHHSNTVESRHRNADGYHSHAHNHTNSVFYDEHEIHLPSGRVAGHRSLRKYFRQNLHNYPTQAEQMARAQRLLAGSSEEDEEMEDANDAESPKSRALLRRGEAGMLGVTNAQKQEVKKQEQKSRTSTQRAQNRYQAKLEKQANSQKHFRDPLLQ